MTPNDAVGPAGVRSARRVVGGALRRARRLVGGGRPDRKQSQPDRVTAPPDTSQSQWFWDHYDGAANQVISFLADAGITLTGRDVADVGCGDGITDLGLAHKAEPARIVGYDINVTNRELLTLAAAREGVESQLPECLEFDEAETLGIPADDHSFDAVVSWSAFEHIAKPAILAAEIRRVLKPHGVLFLQLWPFYLSEHGSHLWDWFEHEPFVQLRYGYDEIQAIVTENRIGADPDWCQVMLREFRALNQVTLDDLQRALLAGGLVVRKAELYTSPIDVPGELSEYRLADLAVSGIKLLAIPTEVAARG
jgi:SAM-dependent methyltransferase